MGSLTTKLTITPSRLSATSALPTFSKTNRNEDPMKLTLRSMHAGATAATFALLLGAAGLAAATDPPKKTPPPPKPAVTKPAPKTGGTTAPKTGGSTGSVTTHGPTTGGITTGGATTHTPITTGGTKTGATTGGTTTQFKPGKESPTGTGGGKVTATPLNTRNNTAGRSIDPGYGRTPKGLSVRPVKGGASLALRPGGKPAGFHDPSRGIDTHHGLNGGFHGTVFHPDHSGVYFAHGRPGFVQRPYHWHGHDFGRRAYYWHGHPYYGYYHGWGWRGGYYNVYAPGFFFAPAFYGWAYNPWYQPIGWGWGWGVATPWYGFYGGWFTPFPTYASPAFWLTDYIISQNLAAAYAAHQEGGEEVAAGGGEAVLSPEVKQQIADEVRAQIALENQEAQVTAAGQDIDPGSSGIGRLLTDGKQHIFVANGALDVVDAGSGAECALSDGDVLQLTGPPAADATSADLVVLASKGGNECGKTATVTVNFSDLQEMQNSMRQTLDTGLKELQAKQGTGGIPQAPPSTQAAPTQAPYAAIAPPPDPADEQQIQQQEAAAQQAEQQAQTQTASQ
jgi:hypothetical protein